MAGYKHLNSLQRSFEPAVSLHRMIRPLPAFEKFESGNQVRRASGRVYAQIAETYSRRRYKTDFIKLLAYGQASGYECISHMMRINQL